MVVSMKQMTPWFPGTVAPARDGVYELFPIFGLTASYARFQRGRWFAGRKTPRSAQSVKMESLMCLPSRRVDDLWQWRGFTTKQEG